MILQSSGGLAYRLVSIHLNLFLFLFGDVSLGFAFWIPLP